MAQEPEVQNNDLFRQIILDKADNQVVFIGAKELAGIDGNGVTEAHVDAFARMAKSQSGMSLDEIMTSVSEMYKVPLENLTPAYVTGMFMGGAAAALPLKDPEGQDICFVKEPDADYDEKAEIAEAIVAGTIPEANLKAPAGSEEVWTRLVATHEFDHCVEGVPIFTGGDQQEFVKDKNVSESHADHTAIGDVLQSVETPEDKQGVQDFIDRRIISGFDPTNQDHGSMGIFLGENAPAEVTQDHIQAGSYFGAIMVEGVSTELKILPADAKEMMQNDPQAFVAVVQDLVEKNAFDDNRIKNEHVPAFIDNFIGALDRQTESVAPEEQQLEQEQQQLPEQELLNEDVSAADPAVISHDNVSDVLPPDSDITVQTAGIVNTLGAVSFAPVISLVAASTVGISQMVNGEEINQQQLQAQRDQIQQQELAAQQLQQQPSFQIPEGPSPGNSAMG